MYYLIFSDKNIRNRHSENLSQISTRNKFDLRYMKKMFKNGYNLYYEKNKIWYTSNDAFLFLREVCAIHGHTFYKCPYILELEDKDAVMAILAHDKLTKNNQWYDIKFHGHIGPFTSEDRESVLDCVRQLYSFHNVVGFLARASSKLPYKHKKTLGDESVSKVNAFSELSESLLNDASFMNRELSQINDLCIETYERYHDNSKKFGEIIKNLEIQVSNNIRSHIPANIKKG